MRTPITLKIKFKSSNLEQFIERYSVDVSRGGIFIRTKEPLPVGTQLRFEFQLQDAQSLIAGDGTVVWIREHDPARQGVAPGMGVRFDKIVAESQKVLDRILSEKNKRGDAQLESRFDAGVRASASASGTLSSQPARSPGRDDFSGGDSKTNTPLPGAVPGLEAPGDEFGNESTRVMQNELVQSLADRTRGLPEEAANAFSEPEPTRKASVEELKLAVAEARPKDEAKVEVAAEASQPDIKPVEKPVELIDKKDEPKLETKAVEKAEKKDEPKPLELIEKKDQPKLETKAAEKPEKKDEPKPAEKKIERDEPKVAARAGDRSGKDEVRAATATAPVSAIEERRGGNGMWVALAGVAAVAAVGAFVVFHKNDDGNKPADVVQTDSPKPTEQAAAAPSKVDPAAQAANTPKPAEPTTAQPKVEKPAGLSVAITSEPVGATVTVDGKPLAEPTPTTLDGLDVKKVYDVRVAMKGFHDWKVKLKPKAGDKLDAAMVPNEKLVEVSSTPAGADVVLDGKRVGRTPFTIHKLDLSKVHAIEVKHTGYVAQSRNVTATDLFQPKGDKDVLALAMTLEAEPKSETPVKPAAVKKPAPRPAHPMATKKPETAPAEKPGETDKPAEAATPASKPDETPAIDKPAEDRPAEKPVAEKPSADKPVAEKPVSDKGEKAAEKPTGDSPAPQQ